MRAWIVRRWLALGRLLKAPTRLVRVEALAGGLVVGDVAAATLVLEVEMLRMQEMLASKEPMGMEQYRFWKYALKPRKFLLVKVDPMTFMKASMEPYRFTQASTESLRILKATMESRNCTAKLNQCRVCPWAPQWPSSRSTWWELSWTTSL